MAVTTSRTSVTKLPVPLGLESNKLVTACSQVLHQQEGAAYFPAKHTFLALLFWV